MSHYVYILRCEDKSNYVGSTANIRRRIFEHVDGLVSSTKNKRPLKLIWYSCFADKNKALEFERYLKKGSGFAFSRKRLISAGMVSTAKLA